MSFEDQGDAPQTASGKEKTNGMSSRRIRRGGVAFDIDLVGISSPVVPKRVSGQSEKFSVNDPLLCAQKVNEKLAAAEARREFALNEVRIRGAEKTQKLVKARAHRWWVKRASEEREKNSIDKDLDDAQAYLLELRESQLENVKKQNQQMEKQLLFKDDAIAKLSASISELEDKCVYLEETLKKEREIAALRDDFARHTKKNASSSIRRSPFRCTLKNRPPF